MLAAVLALGACSTVGYYSQSIGGHLGILRAARPIDDWLGDPATPAALRARLAKVRAMRRFAATDLALPDNRSYTTYADLKRPYVVWNVFATPELSLRLDSGASRSSAASRIAATTTRRTPRPSRPRCARRATTCTSAASLRIRRSATRPTRCCRRSSNLPEGEVARLIFHELAHQVVYVQGDTTFNESFAVAVEEEGVKRWFRHEAATDGASSDAAAAAYRLSAARRTAFVALLTRHRVALEEAYAHAPNDDAKRAAKKAAFASLQADYAAAKKDPGDALHDFTGYDRYFAQPLNNANLAAVAAYSQRVPAFAKLIDRDGGDLPRFYRDVEALAALPKRGTRRRAGPAGAARRGAGGSRFVVNAEHHQEESRRP